MGKKVVIIGSGLGGLECGSLLSRKGFDVTVLEQHSVIGGCLQSFRRGDAVFNTGLHFVGGQGEDGSLAPLFADFGLLDLPWNRLDGEEVIIGEDSFFLPSGYDAYTDALCGFFPSSADDIASFADALSHVAEHPEYMEMNAYDFLCGTIHDPLLRKVVSGTSLKLELDAERLPLYTFARINDAFIRGTWTIRGGGSQIACRLADGIKANGGDVKVGKKVVAVDSSDGRVSSVTVEGGERYEADYVISDIHPAVLAAMTDGIRKVYKSRIAALENTKGLFTVNVKLGPGAPEGENRSIYVHSEDADLWRPRLDVLETVGVCFGEGTVDLMTRTVAEDRHLLASECIHFVGERLPWLRNNIENIYTSTPDTYQRFTGTPDGSAYGIIRDCNDMMRTSLSVRTPLPNLFLTGQNVGIHGILGVTKSAFRTCEEILNRQI